MHPIVLDVLQRQQRDGFPDLAGTEVSATIPISERLLNDLIAKILGVAGKIREVRLLVEEGNRITAKIRLAGPSVLPPIPVTVVIDEQPHLPHRPFLALRLSRPSGLVALAAPAVRSFATFPAGISLEGDRILVDIQRLLAERNLQEVLQYVTELTINTRAGVVVLDVRAQLRRL